MSETDSKYDRRYSFYEYSEMTINNYSFLISKNPSGNNRLVHLFY